MTGHGLCAKLFLRESVIDWVTRAGKADDSVHRFGLLSRTVAKVVIRWKLRPGNSACNDVKRLSCRVRSRISV